MTMSFHVSKAKDGRFRADGLRAFFEYRDLGMREATDGKAVAHVIRARPGAHTEPQWHKHGVEFQMYYVLKGWVRFEYEGAGEILAEPGDCVHQPPGIRHREIDHSDDLELIEIVLPADFRTELVEPPPG